MGLVTVAEKQESVFGDVQLGVDVLADDLMWDICKTEPLIKEGASEEEPEVREMYADGKFCICWDPLDGSSIVDNNWAVGTIVGIWGSKTGISARPAGTRSRRSSRSTARAPPSSLPS